MATPELSQTLARVEELERELAHLDRREAARDELARLEAEHAERSSQPFQLPVGEVLRLQLGLLVLVAAGFDLIAWYSPWESAPPFLDEQAVTYALVGTFLAVLIIGPTGPHRLVALLAPLPLAGILVLRALQTPRLFQEIRPDLYAFDLDPHIYRHYFVPGHAVVVFVVLLTIVTRRRRR